jgi:SAM-dependent methyltransferase
MTTEISGVTTGIQQDYAPRAMGLATTLWLSAARLARRPRLQLDFPERRRRLVAELAPGRSFVDVGGMWNAHGEIAFDAEAAGARRVTLFDAMEPTPEFDAERERRGSAVDYVQGDLHSPADIAALGEFDVVWCAGVVYHSPNPLLQLGHLRRLCRERLLLGSHVIPEVPGMPGACLYYPAISGSERRSFRGAHGGEHGCLGVTEPFDPAGGYGNYWFGLTPSALRSMLETAGFRVLSEHRYTTFLADFVAEPAPGPAPLPPQPGGG